MLAQQKLISFLSMTFMFVYTCLYAEDLKTILWQPIKFISPKITRPGLTREDRKCTHSNLIILQKNILFFLKWLHLFETGYILPTTRWVLSNFTPNHMVRKLTGIFRQVRDQREAIIGTRSCVGIVSRYDQSTVNAKGWTAILQNSKQGCLCVSPIREYL